MLRIMIGIALGVFIAQNYTVPDMKTYFEFIQQSLVDFEKDLSKKQK
jgi:hypothetical protein